MKVIDLRCNNGHGFEGWFASDDEFLEQNGRRMIACPLCADSVIVRLPSAPRLNLSGARDAPAPAPAAPADAQALWLKAVRHLLANTEDVGERFADEARRIHYGEAPERGIRGQASAHERDSLREEGIEVMPLALPAALKEPLQ
jgi:hypothetical protein